MAGGNYPGGFKLPVVTSSYHEKCIAASLKAYQAAFSGPPSSDKTYSMQDHRSCNQVAQNQIWKENVLKEYVASKRWKNNWGFITEYDHKGRKRDEVAKDCGSSSSANKGQQQKQLVPPTTSKQYGLNLSSSSSRSMLQFERLTSFHKRKSGLESNYT